MKESIAGLVLLALILVHPQKCISQTLNNFDSLYNAAYSQLDLTILETALKSAVDNNQKAKSHYLAAWIQKKEGMYYDAVNSYFSALKFYRELNDTRQQANILDNIGVIYRLARFHDASLGYYQQSLEFKTSLGDTLGMARTLHNIGRVFRFNQDSDRAIMYFQQALDIYQQLDYRQGISATYNEIGLCYRDIRMLNQARGYYEKAIAVDQEHTAQEIKELNNIGETYIMEGDYDLAIDYFNQTLNLFSTGKSNKDRALVNQNLGKVYDSLNSEQALKYYELSFEEGVFGVIDPEYIEICGRLMHLYRDVDAGKERHYSDLVLEAATRLVEIKDQIHDLNIQYQVSSAHYKQQAEEENLARNQQEKQNWLINIGIMIAASIFTWFAVRRIRKELGRLREKSESIDLPDEL